MRLPWRRKDDAGLAALIAREQHEGNRRALARRLTDFAQREGYKVRLLDTQFGVTDRVYLYNPSNGERFIVDVYTNGILTPEPERTR